ncbi:hypothetical protein VR611_06280 [Aquirufa nivalisilvae]
MKIEEIIVKHIGNLSDKWHERKLHEFQNSPFFVDNVLLNDQPIIKEYFTCDYDEDGFEINPDIILKEHEESKFRLTFEDFAKSSKSYYYAINLLSVYGDTDQWLMISDYDPNEQVEDLESSSLLLAKKLFEYGSKFFSHELYGEYLENAVNIVKLNLDSIKDFRIEPFKSFFFESFNSEIEKYFSDYLEYKYLIKNDDSLDFDLNLEELSALFAIIENAGFIKDKKNLQLFASKYFKINNPKGGGYVNFLYKDFQDRLNKQLGNKKHRTIALEQVNDRLFGSFDNLMEFKISSE